MSNPVSVILVTLAFLIFAVHGLAVLYSIEDRVKRIEEMLFGGETDDKAADD